MPPFFGTDIVISGPRGIVAAVEVKNRQDLTPDVAMVLRRNMLAHGVVPAAQYFLLASQDRAYLWSAADVDSNAPPAHEIPMAQVVKRYLPKDLAGQRLRSSELEFVVSQWLSDLASGRYVPDAPDSPLVTSGFIHALRGDIIITRAGAA